MKKHTTKEKAIASIKAILICSLLPLLCYWGFNFGGFVDFQKSEIGKWIWLALNLIFVLVFIGLMVVLYFRTKLSKTQDPELTKLFKKMQILAINAFVIIPITFGFDLTVLWIKDTKALGALVAINMMLESGLLGLTIYALVKLFESKKASKTTTKTTTTTVSTNN